MPQLAQQIVLHNMGPYASLLGSSSGGGGGGVRGKGKKGKKGRHRWEKDEAEDTYDAAGRINLKGILVRTRACSLL